MEQENTKSEASPDVSGAFKDNLDVEFDGGSSDHLQLRSPQMDGTFDPYDPAMYAKMARNPAISEERIRGSIQELKQKDVEERTRTSSLPIEGEADDSKGQPAPSSLKDGADGQLSSKESLSEITRPGISPETIKALGIRRVSRDEARDLLGLGCRGIYIPFPNVTENDAPYGRLRLDEDERRGDMKYFQRKDSSPHNYIQKDISLHKNLLILVEGEFKSIALTEAGYPAIGMSGFYSWGEKLDPRFINSKRKLETDFAATISRLKPDMLVFIGDSDTATNFQFSDSVVKLARTSGLPVLLPRIPYDAPFGKGVDDIRESLGQEKFKIWLDAALLDAASRSVTSSTSRDELIFSLLDKHEPDLRIATVDRQKLLERLYKMGIFFKATQLDRLGAYVERLYSTSPARFKAQVSSLRKVYRFKHDAEIDPELFDIQLAKLVSREQTRANNDEPTGTQIEHDALKHFLIIGKEFYGYSYDPKTGSRSKSLSICDRSFVVKELIAAGYEASGLSNDETPVCGLIPNLSPLDAALVYLNRMRCKAMVKRLFRPYGPITEDDGSRVFNNSTVQVMAPVESSVGLNDPRILFTKSWLTALLGEEQLEHFLCLLSYVYNNARTGTPKKSRAVFLVGGPNSGKTLLIDFFVPMLFGQSSAADAHRLFKGEMGASSVLETYVCKLSDADIGTSGSVRRIQMGILGLLADFTVSGRLLYQNVTTEEVINLFMFSTNPDGSTVQLLKDMPESIADKFAFYETRDGLPVVGERHEGEMFSPEETYLREYRSKPVFALREEAPYFCALLRDWYHTDIFEENFEPRFGVAPYFAENLKTVFLTDGDEATVIEILDEEKFEKKTATAIYKLLCTKDRYQSVLRSITTSRFREILLTLSKTMPDLVYYKPTESGVRTSPKNMIFTITGRNLRASDIRLDSN